MSKNEHKGTILVGDGEELLRFYSKLKRPERVAGIFCSYATELPENLVRLGRLDEVSEYLDKQVEVQRVYCSMSRISQQDVQRVQYACKARAVRFCMVLPIVNELDVPMVHMRVGKNTVLTPESEPLTRFHNRILKRLFDLVVVLLFMLTLFPFVYLFKAMNIKRKKLGPSFVTDRCCGPNGRPFNRVSFRTKKTPLPLVDEGGSIAPADTMALAEPGQRSQLGTPFSMARVFNVLMGSMSLVGPDCYELGEQGVAADLPKRLERRDVKCGMTGWARIHKKTEGTERLDADIWYVENWSLWLDIRILLRSIF
ncbi:MAG: sugar transferase [Bacteroidales bacterium]|nr:sugar transferase [Candidatus Physcousia equi]